jgi:osmotically inducible protein OsmC
LVAAAHAACFSMALSGALARAGTPPEHLDVSAEVTFDKLEAGWRVVSSALTVRGRVPGMSAADFEAAAQATKDGCPPDPGSAAAPGATAPSSPPLPRPVISRSSAGGAGCRP